jgi:hypothetical protein
MHCRRPTTGIASAMQLLQAAKARGILDESAFDMGLKLLLRRHGLVPMTVTK